MPKRPPAKPEKGSIERIISTSFGAEATASSCCRSGHCHRHPRSVYSYVAAISARKADITTYTDFRRRGGHALLLGLEILVVADIIWTVVLGPTLVLGLLVVIRTFLSWSLVLEIEERWPWQAARGESERGIRTARASHSAEKV